MIKRCFVTTAAVLCLLCGHAWAGIIAPVSYSYTNGTPAGESIYTDPGATFLTDGNLAGFPDITLGGWVFWQSTGSPQITFDFGSPVTIGTVSIDMYTGSQANTHIPEFVAINGGPVNSPDTLAGDPARGFINFTGSWTGSTLVLDLGHSTGHWIGLDEVQFLSGNASPSSGVPEPGTFMLLGAALLGIGGTRYRRLLRQR